MNIINKYTKNTFYNNTPPGIKRATIILVLYLVNISETVDDSSNIQSEKIADYQITYKNNGDISNNLGLPKSVEIILKSYRKLSNSYVNIGNELRYYNNP